MPEFPSGTVAFLFTDIEGSTRRWETDAQAMGLAVERHFALLRHAIAAQDGVLFKTIGDAVQAAFPTVPKAVAAAVAAQTALREETWDALGPLRVRMAIHVGEATPHQGDYLAPALNRLARLLGTSYGEQILLSEAARSLVVDHLPPEHGLLDLGAHRLRDLLQPEHVFQLTAPGLRLDFPPLKSLDRLPNNLPAQPTPLIGRENELASLRALIADPGTRLVTLTGPGGTGKTRLAMQVAAESLEAFADGVWWAPLATITDPELVPAAIAAPLEVHEIPGEPLLATLGKHLASRRVLLLLDNLEQVVAAAPLLGRLLDEAPRLVILATSRESLRLRAEREFPVAPLPLPLPMPGAANSSLEAALASPAVRLFVERAQAVKPGFTIVEGNVADIVAICRRLDGLPLAIELAAARVRLLSPPALLARLDQRFSLLTGGARDLPARQQTLRAAIAWSHDLLLPPERALFARLAVFAGGCTFDAAERVCSAAGGLPLDLFDGLDSLVQKSLLRQDEGVGGEARFAMLETIREFAQEQFAALPEADTLRRVHADTYLALAEASNWDDWTGQADLLDRLEADYANLRQAIGYYEALGAAGTAHRVRLVAALRDFWRLRSHFREGRQLLESALSAPGDVPPIDRARAIEGAALFAQAQWDLPRARQLHEKALALYRSAGDPQRVARSLSSLGEIARHDGDLDEARTLHQEALDVWRATGDSDGAASALLHLAVVSHLRGDHAHAEPLMRQSLDLFTRIGDTAGEAAAHQWLGIMMLTLGKLDEAAAQFAQSLPRWRRLGNRQMTAGDLANLGETRHLAGALADAESLYQDARRIYEEIDDQMGLGFVQTQLGRLALNRDRAQEALDVLQTGFHLRWEAGDLAGAADSLDALAEAAVRSGDIAWAQRIVTAGDLLRAETGIARLPVYAARHAAVKSALGPMEPRSFVDLGAAVEWAMSGATDRRRPVP
jgi:predicted ATPase/class 3 adenylate cyclase